MQGLIGEKGEKGEKGDKASTSDIHTRVVYPSVLDLRVWWLVAPSGAYSYATDLLILSPSIAVFYASASIFLCSYTRQLLSTFLCSCSFAAVLPRDAAVLARSWES